MPTATHLPVNTGQWEGAASVTVGQWDSGTVGQWDSGTAGQRDAKSRELTASIFFRLSSIF